MTTDRSPALVRSRPNRVLGGVCAGVADRLGIDPLLVRLLTALLAVFSGGAVALLYVVLWVLLPEAASAPSILEAAPPAPSPETTAAEVLVADAPSEDARATDTPAADPRGAWTAVTGAVRALTGELRRSRTTGTPTARPDRRPAPLRTADRAVSAVGDRLRTPEVQASAQQVAARLSDAVRVSADELGRRTRRG